MKNFCQIYRLVMPVQLFRRISSLCGVSDRVKIRTGVWVFLFFGMGLYQTIMAQDKYETDAEVLENTIEEQAEKIDDETEVEGLTEKIEDLRTHPVNLNNAGLEELGRLFMLNDFQILAILDYRKTYGDFVTIYELQNVPGFTAALASQISDFVIIEKPKDQLPSLRDAIRHGRHQWYIRGQRTLEKTDGYQAGEGHYLGNPWKVYSRYAYSYQSMLSAGVTMEKDAGESFPMKQQKTFFDFQSGYIRVDQESTLKTFVAGDYQLKFGQGLVLWNGYSSGKGSHVLNIRRRNEGIARFVSTEENRFFRGAATTLRLRNSDLSLFFSMKPIDANITRYDSLHGHPEVFSSLLTTGLHNTEASVKDRDAVKETVFGGNLCWNGFRFSIGTSWVHYQYNAQFSPFPEPYKYFAFRGNENTLAGIDCQYKAGKTILFAEAARSLQGKGAITAGALVKAASSLTLLVGLRNFSPGYQNPYARPFSESFSCSNESGIFSGMEMALPFHLMLKGYLDWYKFPWLRYQVNAPSEGREGLIQLDWNPSRNLSMYCRFKQETKEINGDGDTQSMEVLIPRKTASIRFQATYVLATGLQLQSRIQAGFLSMHEGNVEKSTLFSQDISWKPESKPFSLGIRYALFDAGSYDSRIYAYESDLLYVYSAPSFYGKGTRNYLVISFRILRRIDCWIKLGQTRYLNRYESGSGDNHLPGNQKTDLGVQMRVRL